MSFVLFLFEIQRLWVSKSVLVPSKPQRPNQTPTYPPACPSIQSITTHRPVVTEPAVVPSACAVAVTVAEAEAASSPEPRASQEPPQRWASACMPRASRASSSEATAPTSRSICSSFARALGSPRPRGPKTQSSLILRERARSSLMEVYWECVKTVVPLCLMRYAGGGGSGLPGRQTPSSWRCPSRRWPPGWRCCARPRPGSSPAS